LLCAPKGRAAVATIPISPTNIGPGLGPWATTSKTIGSVLIQDGDSRAAGGHGGSQPMTNYMTGLAQPFTMFEVAKSGETIGNRATNFPVNVWPLYGWISGYNIAVLGPCGINDAAFGISETNALLELVEYCSAVHLRGGKVIVSTEISCTNVVGWDIGNPQVETVDQWKNTYNGLLYTNWSKFADGLADLHGIAQLGPDGAYANPTWFNQTPGDMGIHPTAAGSALIGAVLANAVNQLVAGPPINTSYIYGVIGSTFTGTLQYYALNLVAVNNDARWFSVSFPRQVNARLSVYANDPTLNAGTNFVVSLYTNMASPGVTAATVAWHTLGSQLTSPWTTIPANVTVALGTQLNTAGSVSLHPVTLIEIQ
jgi:hypothetical protein